MEKEWSLMVYCGGGYDINKTLSYEFIHTYACQNHIDIYGTVCSKSKSNQQSKNTHQQSKKEKRMENNIQFIVKQISFPSCCLLLLVIYRW